MRTDTCLSDPSTVPGNSWSKLFIRYRNDWFFSCTSFCRSAYLLDLKWWRFSPWPNLGSSEHYSWLDLNLGQWNYRLSIQMISTTPSSHIESVKPTCRYFLTVQGHIIVPLRVPASDSLSCQKNFLFLLVKAWESPLATLHQSIY